MKKRLSCNILYTAILLVFTIIIPIITDILLFTSAKIEGNILYKSTAAVLPYITQLLITFCLFSGIAFIIQSVYCAEKAKKSEVSADFPSPVLTVGMNLISVLIIYSSDIIIPYLLSYRFSYLVSYHFMILALNLAVSLVEILAVFALSHYLFGRAKSKNPKNLMSVFATLIVFAVNLSGNIINTVSDLLYAKENYGAALPVNATEWIYLISPYIKIAVLAVIGYAILRIMLAIFDKRDGKIGKQIK